MMSLLLVADNIWFKIAAGGQIQKRQRVVTAYDCTHRTSHKRGELRFEIFVVFQNALSFHFAQKKAPCTLVQNALCSTIYHISQYIFAKSSGWIHGCMTGGFS